jgi:serine kinase of HPr protein (carbohydrate metabolism regulator)
MRPVTVREILACRARLGIIQVVGLTDSLETVNQVFPYPAQENGRIPKATPPHAILLFPPGAAKRNFLNGQIRRVSPAAFRNIPCIAVSGREIPDDLKSFSESTGIPAFASCYDHFLVYSRLIGLLREMGERTVVVHGVLVRILGRGVLIMGESGVGKTAFGLSLMHSDNRWVADDAVILEGRGDALYGRGHERTRDWIAVRGRGILRAEELLDGERLLGQTRVDLIIRLIRASGKGEKCAEDPFREFVGVSIPCRDFATDVDLRRTADRLLDCVRGRMTAQH